MNQHPIQTYAKRIIAMLFAMAILAERASSVPRPLRAIVLFILRRGEAVAYSHVYWALRDCGVPLSWAAPAIARKGSCPEAALALSMWLRTLALLLRDLPRRVLIVQRARSVWTQVLASVPLMAALASPQAPDTS